MPRLSSHQDPQLKPNIGIYSFGPATNGQVNGQFEFDVTYFRDPQGQKQFQGKDGLDKDVIAWIRADRRIPILIKECSLLADDLLSPKGEDKKKISTWVSFCFRDPHGKWISPAVAEIIADTLSDAGFNVIVSHQALLKK